jgi:hypothetical protein
MPSTLARHHSGERASDPRRAELTRWRSPGEPRPDDSAALRCRSGVPPGRGRAAAGGVRRARCSLRAVCLAGSVRAPSGVAARVGPKRAAPKRACLLQPSRQASSSGQQRRVDHDEAVAPDHQHQRRRDEPPDHAIASLGRSSLRRSEACQRSGAPAATGARPRLGLVGSSQSREYGVGQEVDRRAAKRGVRSALGGERPGAQDLASLFALGHPPESLEGRPRSVHEPCARRLLGRQRENRKPACRHASPQQATPLRTPWRFKSSHPHRGLRPHRCPFRAHGTVIDVEGRSLVGSRPARSVAAGVGVGRTPQLAPDGLRRADPCRVKHFPRRGGD